MLEVLGFNFEYINLFLTNILVDYQQQNHLSSLS